MFVVSDLLFPKHLSLIHVVVLYLTSKRLRRLMDAQKTVAQGCFMKLGIAKMGIPKNIKLSTFLHQRVSRNIIYSCTTVENLLMKESCTNCLSSPHCPYTNEEEVNLKNRTVRIGVGICTICTVCERCISTFRVEVRPEISEKVTFNGGKGTLIAISKYKDTAMVDVRGHKSPTMLQMRDVKFSAFV